MAETLSNFRESKEVNDTVADAELESLERQYAEPAFTRDIGRTAFEVYAAESIAGP